MQTFTAEDIYPYGVEREDINSCYFVIVDLTGKETTTGSKDKLFVAHPRVDDGVWQTYRDAMVQAWRYKNFGLPTQQKVTIEESSTATKVSHDDFVPSCAAEPEKRKAGRPKKVANN